MNHLLFSYFFKERKVLVIFLLELEVKTKLHNNCIWDCDFYLQNILYVTYVNNSWTYKKIKNCCSWSTKFSANIVPSVCTHSKMMTPNLTKHKRHGVIFNFIFFKLNCWHKLGQNKRQNTSSGRTVRISRRIGSLSTVVPNL